MTGTRQETGPLLVRAACAVGDRVIARAGTAWNVPTFGVRRLGGELRVVRMRSESIWSGTSGLVLFLVRLAGVSGRERYLAAAEGVARQLLRRGRGPRDVGFFSGDAGVAYALREIYECTGRELYLHAALARLKSATVRAEKPTGPDVFSGHAGLLLGLLMVRRADAPAWLDPAIDRCISGLASTIVAGRQGLHWSRQRDVTAGSCGFAHGTAGIGFVLRHAMAVRESTELRWLLSAIHAHEQSLIRKEGYCPDVRRSDVFEDLGAGGAVRGSGDAMRRLREDREFPSWCNGLSGVGLARLAHRSAARSLLGRESLRQWMKRCLVLAEERFAAARCSLCHGAAGELEFVREAAEALDDDATRVRAHALATKIARSLANGERLAGGWQSADHDDVSLFMGETGVAYCLLRFSADVPSVLAPPVPRAEESPRRGVRPLDVRVKVLECLAPRTMTALRERSGGRVPYCRADVGALGAVVSGGAGDRGRVFHGRGSDIRRALVLDLAALGVERSVENMALLTYRLLVTSRMLASGSSLFDAGLLGLAPEARFVVCSSQEGCQERFLITPSPEGARVIPLSAFAHLVLRQFRTPRRARAAAAACLRTAVRGGARRSEAEAAIAAQMLEGVRCGLILGAVPDGRSADAQRTPIAGLGPEGIS